MSIEQGFYRIDVPVAKLDTITADVRERLFTKRSERKITYDGVSNDLDAFIETLQLSRSTTPGTASQGKAIKIFKIYGIFKVLRSLQQLTGSSPRRSVTGHQSAERNVIEQILYDSEFDSTDSEDEEEPSTSKAPPKRRGPKEKALPPAVMEQLESKCI